MKRSAWIALPQVARRLGVSFERALALVRRNQLRARLVDHRYWIAEHELVRYRRKTSRHVAPRSTIRPTAVSQDGGRAA